jgi:predicted glutamine amidotransferase
MTNFIYFIFLDRLIDEETVTTGHVRTRAATNFNLAHYHPYTAASNHQEICFIHTARVQ